MRKVGSRRKVEATPNAGDRLVASLVMLRDVVRSGRNPAEVFTSRTYEVPEPPAFDGPTIRALRESLGVSQSVFAHMIGASLPLVQGWEQGRRVPNLMARRLLAEVAERPQRWRAMTTVRSHAASRGG
jgi:putative transcriptional regulator